MVISIASGKGGTGKTMIASSLALSISGVQLLDCDVEEPDSHIFIKPEIEEKVPVFIPVPEVDKSKCTLCGRCREVCVYNAIAVIKDAKDTKKGQVLVFPELCHGCGACAYLCPEKAIKEVNKEIGIVEIGAKGGLQFVHGKLNIGAAMSPPVIRAVKKYKNETRTVIVDAPPGTSCPVIESIKDSDFCVLVTEPTPFGLNDLVLAVEVARKLDIPFGVIINRYGLGDDKTEDYCRSEGIKVLMRIPFRKDIAAAYSKGVPLIEALPGYSDVFKRLFEDIKTLL